MSFAFIARGQAGGHEFNFQLVKPQRGALHPVFKGQQAVALHEITGIPLGRFPICRRVQQFALHAHVLAALGQPFAQPFPAANQGFVRHLDSRAARRLVAVKGQQSIATEAIDHIFDDITVAQSQQLGLQDAPARIFLPFTQRDQAQEHLPRHILAGLVEAAVYLFRAFRQGAQGPADVLVGGDGQQRAFAPFE